MNIKEAAVAHALSCLQHDRLVLRDKQLEAVKLLYEGQDVFIFVGPYRLRQVYLLSDAALLARCQAG